MPTQISDVIEASARAEHNGVDDVVNVWQFVLGTPGPLSDNETADDIISLLEGIYDQLTAAQTNLLVYRDVRITNVTQDRVLGVFPWATMTTGAAELAALPPGVAGILNFLTNIARVTLRKYFGGLTVGAMDADGTFTAAIVTALAAIAADLLDVFVETNGDWMYGTLSPKTLEFEFPNSSVANDIPAYQRRRKQGRGS